MTKIFGEIQWFEVGLAVHFWKKLEEDTTGVVTPTLMAFFLGSNKAKTHSKLFVHLEACSKMALRFEIPLHSFQSDGWKNFAADDMTQN